MICMKTIYHSVLPGTVILMLMALSTQANLVTGTDPAFGAGSLTIDTQTGLAWLNLSATADLSYNEVVADMQPGGLFSNYTYATIQEVDGLYADAGIGGTGYFPLSTPAIGSLISLVGATKTQNGEPGFNAILGNAGPPDSQEAASIYVSGVDGIDEWFVSDGTYDISTAFGDSYSDPTIASWLVTTVPEPGVGSVAFAGLIGLVFVRRLKSQP